jgi:predicted MFS family arabinose efflux permease
MGLVPQTVSGANLQQANALNGLVSSASITVGSIAGGLLVAGVGAGWAIGIDALTYLLSAWFLVRLRPQTAVPDEAAGESFITDLKAGWHEFRSHDWLWVMVLGASVFLFIVEAPLQVLGPVVAQDVYDGARTWGFAAAAMGVGQVIGGALALRWRPRRPLLIVAAGMSLTALPVAMLAFEAPLVFLLVGTAVLGVEWGLYDPFWMTVMQQHVAPEMLSRVVSYDYLGSLSMYPLGLAVAGPLADQLGIETVLLISAGGAIVLSAFQVSMPGVRGLTQERAPIGGPAPMKDGRPER